MRVKYVGLLGLHVQPTVHVHVYFHLHSFMLTTSLFHIMELPNLMVINL